MAGIEIGIEDIGPSCCVVLECKSIDPRANIDEVKPEHLYQVQVQLGLIRKLPRIVVAQDIASHPGLGALLGQVHFNIQRALGCVGVVTNGAVRSIPTAEALRFQIFADKVSVSHAYTHIVEFGTPVEVDGLKVHSGELLHGDQHGVQSIPLGIVAQIPPIAARISARKRELIALCQSPEFSLEELRAAIAKESA